MFFKKCICFSGLQFEMHEKTHDVAYDNVLKAFDKVWCIEALIATRSSIVVSWKSKVKAFIIN